MNIITLKTAFLNSNMSKADEEVLYVKGDENISLPTCISFAQNFKDKLINGGDKIAQICAATGEQTTYRNIIEKSVSLATSLKKFGVVKGDAISLMSENRFEFPTCIFAGISLGAFIAPINPAYTPNEVLHALNLSKPKIIFCTPLTVERVLSVSDKAPYIQKIILMGDSKPHEKLLLYDDLVSEYVDPEKFQVEPVDIKKHPLALLCSSGTTGMPKGVLISHNNLLVCVEYFRRFNETLDSERIELTLVPWFHAYGFVTHLVNLYVNEKCVFMKKFEEDLFLKTLQDYKIANVKAVPPLVLFLARSPLVDKYDLSHLQTIGCGAAPLSKEIEEEVIKRLKLNSVYQAYGMTETTLGVLMKPLVGEVKQGSCGKVVPGMICKVVDVETGKALGPNQNGELCFKGPLIMLGYIGDQEATKNVFDSEGFLHTGDIGYYDEERNFFIVDRLKELIKYKGFQVAPAELEALLLQHPGVKDVGVVGLPDDLAGELPLAFVVRNPNSKVTEKDLIEFVAKSISYHKRLHGGVRFVDAIPRNPSGKILRKDLRILITGIPKSKL